MTTHEVHSAPHQLDPSAFLADFHHTATYGATAAGGIDRQAGTAEHGAVRDWFCSRAAELGFDTRVDEIGNVFALRSWDPRAPYVVIGSHLDSQPLGGRFDGTYGVIAALHAAHAIAVAAEQEGATPALNLAVADWFNEEGARFPPSIMGSSVFAGLLDLDDALATADPEGVTVAEAIEATGHRGQAVDLPVAAYAEIHIEQGRRLERAGLPIGLVQDSWHTQKLLVRVLGEQSHTGATAMADRRDALIAASHVVLMAEQVTEEFPAESIVTSVGKFDVLPNSPIVVPRQVDLVLDIRADDPDHVQRARELLLQRMQELAQRRNVEITATDFDIRPVQRFPAEGVDLGAKAAGDEGADSMVLATMAGHDSVAINRIAPAMMLFVPSVDGVSHCEREFTSDADLVVGLRVLTQAAQRLINGELSDVAPAAASQ